MLSGLLSRYWLHVRVLALRQLFDRFMYPMPETHGDFSKYESKRLRLVCKGTQWTELGQECRLPWRWIRLSGSIFKDESLVQNVNRSTAILLPNPLVRLFSAACHNLSWSISEQTIRISSSLASSARTCSTSWASNRLMVRLINFLILGQFPCRRFRCGPRVCIETGPLYWSFFAVKQQQQQQQLGKMKTKWTIWLWVKEQQVVLDRRSLSFGPNTIA